MLWKCLVVVLVVFSLLACGADEEDVAQETDDGAGMSASDIEDADIAQGDFEDSLDVATSDDMPEVADSLDVETSSDGMVMETDACCTDIECQRTDPGTYCEMSMCMCRPRNACTKNEDCNPFGPGLVCNPETMACEFPP